MHGGLSPHLESLNDIRNVIYIIYTLYTIYTLSSKLKIHLRNYFRQSNLSFNL